MQSAILEQAANLLQDLPVKIKVVVADLGSRGVDADNPDKDIIHRGKFKSLNPQQKTRLRRRQAVEPAIGHMKSDHRMDRCWLRGAIGDRCTPSVARRATTCAGCCAPISAWASGRLFCACFKWCCYQRWPCEALPADEIVFN